jgi:serine protease
MPAKIKISNICFKIVCLLIFFVLSSPLQIISIEKRDYEPGVLIVKLKKSNGFSTFSGSKIKNYSQGLGAKHIKRLVFPQKSFKAASQQSTFYLVKFTEQESIKTSAEKYQSEEWVEYAEPNYYVYANSFPNDAHYVDQSYLHQTKLKTALKLQEKEDVLVAVIDSGVDAYHIDIIDNIFRNKKEIINGIDDDNNGYIDDAAGYDFCNYSKGQGSNNPIDNYGHGTHIAGIIAAKTNNTIGIAGLNDSTKILNIKFLDSSGRGTQLDAAAAVRYAVDMGAKIINCSWGYRKYNQILKEAIQYATDNDVIVVAAVGNLSSTISEYPAAFDLVLGVASVDLSLNKSNFSSFGSNVDFSAYGRNIFSLLPQNRYGEKSGTSQAAAVVSSMASIILSQNPNLKPNEINNILINSSQDLGQPGKDGYTGYGIIDIPKLFSNMNIILPEEGTVIKQTKGTPQNESKNIFQIIIELPFAIIKGFLDIFF